VQDAASPPPQPPQEPQQPQPQPSGEFRVPTPEEIARDVKSEVPRNINDIMKMPLHLALLVVGGAVGLLIGFLEMVLRILLSPILWKPFVLILYALAGFIFSAIFSIMLFYSYVQAKRNMKNGFFWAVVVSLLMLVFCSALGFISGVIGALLGLTACLLMFIDLNNRGELRI